MRLLTKITVFMFFGLICLFFLIVVDPRLVYHAQEPAFLLGEDFFSGFAGYPGGLIWYISAFLTQFYRYPPAGALIITILVFLIYRQTEVFLKAIGFSRYRKTFGILPAMLLVAAYCNYLLPLSYALGIFIALLFSNLHASSPSGNTSLRLLLFVIFSAAVYYVTGTGAVLFAALCVIGEIFYRKKYASGAAMAMFALLMPFLAAKIFFVVSVQSAYGDFFGIKTSLLEAAQYPRVPPLVYGVYFFYPAMAVVRLLLSITGKKPAWTSAGPLAAVSCLIIVSMAAALVYIPFFHFDRKAKANYQIDYYARHRLWDEIVRAVTPETMRDFSVVSQAHLFRALYYRGRLLSDLFSYPSGLPGLSFQMVTGSIAHCYPVQMSDLYFEIGGLNQAEFWAHEALALKGKKPYVLQRLAMINLLKGRKNSAGKFITLLRKTLFDGKTADVCARLLENDSLIAGDGYLGRVRSYMPRKEYLCRDYYSELVNLFEDNSENRTAFEYIVAENLLNNSISPIVDNTGYFARLGYLRLPRHVQEALALQLVMSNADTATVNKYRLDSNCIRRFNDFNRVLFQYRDDRAAALKMLAAEYGTTCWYYLASNGRPVFLKKKEP